MFKRYLILLMLLAASVVGVQAQETPIAPIIAVDRGNIYTINPVHGSVTQLTHYDKDSYSDLPGWQDDLALSPDGHWLAYLRTPPFFIDGLRDNVIGNYGDTPANIMLLDLTTGVETMVAGQEANVSVNRPIEWWYRREVQWSADSTRLAYVESNFVRGGQDTHVMLFDTRTSELNMLYDSPEPIWRMAWMGDHIYADNTVLTPDGTVIAQWYPHDGMTIEHFMHYQGRDLLIVSSADVVRNENKVYVRDMLTGELGVIEGVEASMSAAQAEGSLAFFKDDNDTRPLYVVNPLTGAAYHPPTEAPYAVSFTHSRDGKQFAYVLINTSVNISDLNGHDLTVDFAADTVIWGHKQYTVTDADGQQKGIFEPTSDFENTKRCGSLPAVGLVASGEGRVIEGSTPNRIRTEPNTEANVIGQIPAGATFTVVDGQQGVCSGSIRWAQVSYENITGWTAEGADGQAFLEAVK